MSGERKYLCIDLKSFYASVECVERELDPMTTDLIVADPERTEKTICLAVTPSLKKKGVRNRCRVFEIPKDLTYITAPPRMQLYIEYSAEIYAIYLKYIAKEDIQVYSIDEAFFDVTEYLTMYRMTARELAVHIMDDVRRTVGITASCGIGTNLYLAKIALDITAKHAPDNIGELDEESYKATLWNHRPITDFWRVGAGTAARLERLGITTMGRVASASEELLYRTFGIDAELLIDHAWGREPTTIADIKGYRPQTKSLTSGQVLSRGYEQSECRIVVREMADALVLDMVDIGACAENATLELGFSGDVRSRSAVHGSCNFGMPTSSAKKILPMIDELYMRLSDRSRLVRRINLSLGSMHDEDCVQYSFFDDPEDTEKEKKMQGAILSIKKKFGKNAILKGMSLEEGATMRERNDQIGGHKA